MLFMAPPGFDDLDGDWPALWARGDDATWRRVDFGRSLQARRLACLLVLSPQGVRAKQAGRALSLDGVDGKGERQNAKRYLGEALSRIGADDLLVLPDHGGRGAPPWAFRQATTDVALAAAAVGCGDWPIAAQLTHGGTASLVGITAPGSPGARWKAALPLSAIRNGREPRHGSLPSELVDMARETASRVRSHRREWEDGVPVETPFACPEPATRPPGASEPTVQAAAVPRGAGPGLDLVVIPMQPPVTPRGRRIAGPIGVAVVALAAILGARLVGTSGTTGVPGSGAGGTAGLASSVGTRAEQETFDHPVNTFSSPTELTRAGAPVPAGGVVRVSCRVYAPSIASVTPDGFWYRISSRPWDDRAYAPANTFLNGDSAARFVRGAKATPGPVHNTDFALATCGGPGGSREIPLAATTPTFTSLRRDASTGDLIHGTAAVVVSCRVYTPQLPATVPSGYAYRLVSPPWNGRSYAAARAFRNGGPLGGAAVLSVDAGVPIC
jgi:hypothetical protein